VGEYKQKLLEVNDFYTRINEVIKYLVLRGEQLKKLEKANKLKPNSSIKTENIDLDKNIKSEIIKELMKNQIGSNSKARNKANVIEELEKKINQIILPEEAKQIALDELEKLKSQGPGNNPEHEWIINYLNTFLKLPWDKVTMDNDDIKKTREILDRDHFGLEKVKKRIIEYLSVRKLNNQENKGKGSILCLNGPPGVGKTSLAKSIAEALGKNFYRLSLGGVRDESEIRGHRRTYIASMPGMIMQSLIRAQTKNPVILLDEIDKVGVHFKGDVSSSLLEVLDPEQNSTFKDHYIGTPFDLSEVFFICTSNYLENVAPPLRDRLEVIEIPGYTIEEKSQICKKYLIPKQIKEKGLSNDQIKISLNFDDDIIESMIVHYTFESGVRQLERNVASVCRFVAKNVVEDMENSGIKFASNLKKPEKINVKQNSEVHSQSQSNIPEKINLEANKILTPLNISKSESHIFEKTFEINQKILKEILGKKMLDLDLELRTSNSGVAIGLAYTLNGGAITLIETTSFAGKGQVLITGNMGDVMKESVSTGFSWIKSNTQILGLEKIDFSKTDLHIHVPQAAVPKDGPSAGVTMTVSIVNFLKFIYNF
jgi:ATP-dependent Lon protease